MEERGGRGKGGGGGNDPMVSSMKYISSILPLPQKRLVGLVVKLSASRAEDPAFDSRLRRDFSGSIHTSDLK